MGRALSAREREVLEAMVRFAPDFSGQHSVDEVSRQHWLAQVAGTRAGRRCECGDCPSIELEDAQGSTPSFTHSRIVLSASAPDALVLLFIDDDQLSYLELAPIDPDDQVDEFPALELFDFVPAA
jgi:hypothetical protein